VRRKIATHRRSRAVVAGLTGAALLVGTGATFALWNDEARLQQDIIPLGELAVQAGPLSWMDISEWNIQERDAHLGWSQTARPIPNIGQFILVPGDYLRAEGTVYTTLIGETLQANLTFGNDERIPAFVNHQILFLADDGEVLHDAEAGTPLTTFPAARHARNGAVPVRVYLNIPLTAGNETQEWQVPLSDIRVSLSQVISPQGADY